MLTKVRFSGMEVSFNYGNRRIPINWLANLIASEMVIKAVFSIERGKRVYWFKPVDHFRGYYSLAKDDCTENLLAPKIINKRWSYNTRTARQATIIHMLRFWGSKEAKHVIWDAQIPMENPWREVDLIRCKRLPNPKFKEGDLVRENNDVYRIVGITNKSVVGWDYKTESICNGQPSYFYEPSLSLFNGPEKPKFRIGDKVRLRRHRQVYELVEYVLASDMLCWDCWVQSERGTRLRYFESSLIKEKGQ